MQRDTVTQEKGALLEQAAAKTLEEQAALLAELFSVS